VAPKLIEICSHEEWLKRYFAHNQFIALFANYVKLWKDLAFIFTLIINLFIVGSFSEKFGDRMHNYRLFMNPDYSEEQTKQLFQIFGILMTVCSMFVVAFFLVKNLPLIIKKAWNTGDNVENMGFIQIIITWLIKFLKVVFSTL